MELFIYWASRIFIGLISVILAVSGFIWAFLPGTNMARYDITVDSIVGTNMIKTDIGAPLIAMAIMLALFLREQKKWFQPTLIVGGAYLAVRFVSLFVDGYHQMVVLGIVLELLVLLCLFGAWHTRKIK